MQVSLSPLETKEQELSNTERPDINLKDPEKALSAQSKVPFSSSSRLSWLRKKISHKNRFHFQVHLLPFMKVRFLIIFVLVQFRKSSFRFYLAIFSVCSLE
jgi:hypothetical protein